MRTMLICHDTEFLSRYGLSQWLATFSELVGIIVIQENNGPLLNRIRREISRVGMIRFLDVICFRLYYALFLSEKDRRWERNKLRELSLVYPEISADIPVLKTDSPNSKDAEDFIAKAKPDIMVARCKTLLAKRIYLLPRVGTFVMHPGICPEYRNAHGCFWALACNDLSRVGMTLLKIDAGVDTGPVYGYYTCDYDEIHESHIRIQNRVVLDNLEKLSRKFMDVYDGVAVPLQTTGRKSTVWGQPWLSAYLKWKFNARKRGVHQ